MPNILIAVAVYDGDTHCRQILFRTLEALVKTGKTDLLFILDKDSPATAQELKYWREKGPYGFQNIEIMEAPPYVEDIAYEVYRAKFEHRYPRGGLHIFCVGNSWGNISARFQFSQNASIRKIIRKREMARLFALDNGYDFLLLLDSDLEVEPAALLKLLDMNCAVAAVLYNNAELGEGFGREINCEQALFFSYKIFHKFRKEWILATPICRDNQCYFEGKSYMPVMVPHPRRYSRTSEFHAQAWVGGCWLARREILQLSQFIYHEEDGVRARSDDWVFFLPLFFAGIDDIKFSCDIKAIHHSNERKKTFLVNVDRFYKGEINHEELHYLLDSQFAL